MCVGGVYGAFHVDKMVPDPWMGLRCVTTVETLGIQPTLKGSSHYKNGGLATVRATQGQRWYLLRTHLMEVHSGKTWEGQGSRKRAVANLMAISYGAMEAARDLGLDGMAPGLTPPHLQQAFLSPSTLGSSHPFLAFTPQSTKREPL